MDHNKMSVPVSMNLVRRIVQFDLNDRTERFVRNLDPERYAYHFQGTWFIGLSDLEALLKNLRARKAGIAQLRDLWLIPLAGALAGATSFLQLEDEEWEGLLPDTDRDVCGEIIRALERTGMMAYDESTPLSELGKLEVLENFIRTARNNGHLPVRKRTYPLYIRQELVTEYAYMTEAGMENGPAYVPGMDRLTQAQVLLLHRWTEELCRMGYEPAIRLRAFSCMDGNRIFAPDMRQAKADLVLLHQLDPEDRKVACALRDMRKEV